ncbi:hypothetical protein DAMA08_046090 [Martiniozyma asiatica (nom. inval.)]|nr:hypothetical protein DAMA08_046090 [Martiniozyma asiatica]
MNPPEYLDASFNPSKLTVPQLRSILVSHGVRYASNANKPVLLGHFIDDVFARREVLLEEWHKDMDIDVRMEGLADVEVVRLGDVKKPSVSPQTSSSRKRSSDDEYQPQLAEQDEAPRKKAKRKADKAAKSSSSKKEEFLTMEKLEMDNNDVLLTSPLKGAPIDFLTTDSASADVISLSSDEEIQRIIETVDDKIEAVEEIDISIDDTQESIDNNGKPQSKVEGECSGKGEVEDDEKGEDLLPEYVEQVIENLLEEVINCSPERVQVNADIKINAQLKENENEDLNMRATINDVFANTERKENVDYDEAAEEERQQGQQGESHSSQTLKKHQDRSDKCKSHKLSFPFFKTIAKVFVALLALGSAPAFVKYTSIKSNAGFCATSSALASNNPNEHSHFEFNLVDHLPNKIFNNDVTPIKRYVEKFETQILAKLTPYLKCEPCPEFARCETQSDKSTKVNCKPGYIATRSWLHYLTLGSLPESVTTKCKIDNVTPLRQEFADRYIRSYIHKNHQAEPITLEEIHNFLKSFGVQDFDKYWQIYVEELGPEQDPLEGVNVQLDTLKELEIEPIELGPLQFDLNNKEKKKGFFKRHPLRE